MSGRIIQAIGKEEELTSIRRINSILGSNITMNFGSISASIRSSLSSEYARIRTVSFGGNKP